MGKSNQLYLDNVPGDVAKPPPPGSDELCQDPPRITDLQRFLRPTPTSIELLQIPQAPTEQ